jgi:hypothetical protein
MAERIVKVVCFALVASFCGLVGGIALYFLNHDISADLKAQRVRQAITQLKDLGPRNRGVPAVPQPPPDRQ